MSEQSTFISRVLVGSCIQQPQLIDKLISSIDVTELDPPCDATLMLLAKHRNEGAPYDPHVIQQAVSASRPNVPTNWVALLGAAGNPAAFDFYLNEFRVEVARRTLRSVSPKVLQAADTDDIRLGIERVREAVDSASNILVPQEVPLVDGDEIWSYVAPPESVLIAGLLWRQGKVIITGFEGQGKTVILRQLAMAPALGLHPFTLDRIDPIRTLYLDLENPAAIGQTEMRRMLDTLRDRGNAPAGTFAGRFKFDFKPGGLDILGSGRDREYINRAIATHRPDLLLIGPIYRLAAAGGDLDEQKAGSLINYLNQIRETYDLAIVTEAHCPHGQTDSNNGNQRRVLRPSGSSAWMRFPEIGRGLRKQEAEKFRALGRPVFRLEDWRGDRSREMRFPDYVSRAIQGQVWYDDCSERVAALPS